MGILPKRSSRNKNSSIAINYIASLLIILLFVFYCLRPQSSYANEDNSQLVSKNDDAVQDIVNPFDSDCYDWEEKRYHVISRGLMQNCCFISLTLILVLLIIKMAQ